jgi:hypothetical protein
MLNELLILGAIHVSIAMAVFFVIGLSARAAMLHSDDYKIIVGMIVVVVCFGVELLFSWFPAVFHMVYMHDVLLDILGALLGLMAADFFLYSRYEKIRPMYIANVIYTRYRRKDVYEHAAEVE